MHTFTIGKLAKEAGVGIDTVRFYERIGLLPRADRTASGYRLYGMAEVEQLRFIRRAKALGFTLEEIAELMSLSRGTDMGRVRTAAEAKLADVEARIAELRRVRKGLRQLIERCPGRGEMSECPIVSALGAPVKREPTKEA